jgi:hypothetical protein
MRQESADDITEMAKSVSVGEAGSWVQAKATFAVSRWLPTAVW